MRTAGPRCPALAAGVFATRTAAVRIADRPGMPRPRAEGRVPVFGFVGVGAERKRAVATLQDSLAPMDVIATAGGVPIGGHD
jgi:hypothetical protein